MVGGITVITQNKEALERYFFIAPELSRLTEEFESSFSYKQNSSDSKKHHQLTGSMATRIFQNAAKIKTSISQHCEGNPFLNQSPLMNIVSTMEVPASSRDDILNRDEKGQSAFKKFVTSRLVKESAEVSIWDPMVKMKLKTFSTSNKKIKYIQSE